MALFSTLVALAVAAFSFAAVGVESRWSSMLRMPSTGGGGDVEGAVGTKWAVLIAGSHGFGNYRHQADVCHAYHTMRRGGLKDENIIVFMYDDIAYNEENPRPGVIINSPNGENVYKDVPKDYVGKDVNVKNFLAALLGDKSALTGGSGKVVDSGPNDHIFIFYSDHGGPGVLGMPTSPHLYAKDLVDTLKKKHASGSYKSLVFYLEACESGSVFEGLLPQGLSIYATTAANAEESSWGTYCPDDLVGPPEGYDTCLGDLYSVSWLEDSDAHNLQTETLSQQFRIVKERTSVNGTYGYGSHVMQFGDLELSKEKHIALFMGTNPNNMNFTFTESNPLPAVSSAVNQRDADLLYSWHKYKKAPEGSSKKLNAQKDLINVMSHRFHVDNSMELIGKLLFGSKNGAKILKAVRPSGQPLVDDWDCLKSTVRTFETHCGSLSQYGMKHMRSIANICNVGVKSETMAEVAAQACANVPSSRWSSTEGGFSA